MVKICEDCKKREHKVIFAEEPIYAITHRIGQEYLCRQCYIKRIEVELVRIKSNLTKQKKLLKKEKKEQKRLIKAGR